MTGSLEAGKFADMAAVDLGSVDLQPVYNVLSQLVYSAGRGAVTDVWVAGQILAERKLTTIDEASLSEALPTWGELVRPAKQRKIE